METLSVGMYVKFKTLSNQVKVGQIQLIDNSIYELDNNEVTADKYIVKASYNIIDILEVGDYVNGHRVEEIDFENEEIFTDSEYYCGVVEFCNIKSVITHEQIEQMAYKVGD